MFDVNAFYDEVSSYVDARSKRDVLECHGRIVDLIKRTFANKTKWADKGAYFEAAIEVHDATMRGTDVAVIEAHIAAAFPGIKIQGYRLSETWRFTAQMPRRPPHTPEPDWRSLDPQARGV